MSSPKQVTRWLDANALTLIITDTAVSFHLIRKTDESDVWSSEMSHTAMHDYMTHDDRAFCGTYDEYMTCLEYGVMNNNAPPHFSPETGALVLSVYECEVGSLVHEFKLVRTDISKNLLHMIMSSLTPKEVSVDVVVEPVMPPAQPQIKYTPVHVLFGGARRRPTTTSWFTR